ncbi:hypothetical protein SEA_LITTLETOKYO_8 [Arthrobacter phage LittleTokyo]|nr:hypothetical protein SEA_LITTLETOKYO_8 [Arthrobacter phage LittleTokyo]
MADLKKYNVKVNGFETVLQLDERGAKARGLTEKDLYKPAAKRPAAGSKQADKPENKQTAPAGDK